MSLKSRSLLLTRTRSTQGKPALSLSLFLLFEISGCASSVFEHVSKCSILSCLILFSLIYLLTCS